MFSEIRTNRTIGPTILASGLLWLIIFVFYLLVAPNYRWLPDKGDTPYGADFLQEWVGARIVLEGDAENLYNTALFQARQHDQLELGFAWDANCFFPPVYPPMHYFAFAPLGLMPYRWAVLVWIGTLIAFAILAVQQIRSIAIRESSDTFSSPSGRVAFNLSLLFGFFLFPSVLASLTMGQKSLIWLVILASSWQLLVNKRELAAGFVFGLLSIKPTLFFLLPVVLLSYGRIRFFVGASITVAALWGMGLCLIPSESWFGFLEGVKGSSSYPGMNGYRLDWSCNLLSLAYAAPTPFQWWFKQSVCVILAIYCLLGCFERRNFDVYSPEKLLQVLCVTFLLSPHAYSYDMCLLLLPIYWIYAQQPRVGFVYYMLLTMAVAAAAMVLQVFSLPILPVLLIGIVCELRLRKHSPPIDARGSESSSKAFANVATANSTLG